MVAACNIKAREPYPRRCAGQICLSQNVYDLEEVREVLGQDLLPELAGLKGVSDGLRVYQVA